MKEPKRVLFVNSEILPYIPETTASTVGRYLPQGVQESGKEIRSFMPRYGCINERRNQLHEVIRLSGMNIIVNDIDRPLIIKVASIPSARMQVYFIDNDDYFQRKFIFNDENGNFFEDNDERAIFFARGVLETVKKLRWKPDIIHCQGWISHVLPLYLKKIYKDDPIFTDSKLILSLYDEADSFTFADDMRSKIILPGIKNKDLDILSPANGTNLAKLAVQNADGIIMGSQNINEELASFVKASKLPVLPYVGINTSDSEYIKEYNQFYDTILENNAI
ncbi:MAG: glycogen/starch synthase [Bacteroidales bacterium]|nr:glycogen/starch synthase [Bacteroidales bacterium]MBQ6872605.1 glycogen/starch synthase [Bacteroidales bacterium]MBQ7997817.1 glycogen/starch synthase [Bacteroidales bacterium]